MSVRFCLSFIDFSPFVAPASTQSKRALVPSRVTCKNFLSVHMYVLSIHLLALPFIVFLSRCILCFSSQSPFFSYLLIDSSSVIRPFWGSYFISTYTCTRVVNESICDWLVPHFFGFLDSWQWTMRTGTMPLTAPSQTVLHRKDNILSDDFGAYGGGHTKFDSHEFWNGISGTLG
jgi:hypothetical protein